MLSPKTQRIVDAMTFSSDFGESSPSKQKESAESDDPFQSDDLIGIINEDKSLAIPEIVTELNQEGPLGDSKCASTSNASLEVREASPVTKSTVMSDNPASSPIQWQYYESQLQFRPEMITGKGTSLCGNVEIPTIQMLSQHLSDSDDEDVLPGKAVSLHTLSRRQSYVVELAKSGVSFFFTGSAGTGKSLLLKIIIKLLKEANKPGSVAITASTGLAACSIGGMTLHSFAGIGLGKGDFASLLKLVRMKRNVSERWKATKVLIIDEISMIEGSLFTKLDQIARKIRRKPDLPFGGIQVIVCGDFYQLPPIDKIEMLSDGSKIKKKPNFAFETETWTGLLKHNIVLTEVFRQKGDQVFIEMLNGMRIGDCSPFAEAEFRRLSRPLVCAEDIVATELYPTRDEVDRANRRKLDGLCGEIQCYRATDGGSLPAHIRAQWLRNLLAPEQLTLKEGAQVMCIKNFDENLANGSLGKVLRFVDFDSYMCEVIHEEQPDLSFVDFEKACKDKISKASRERFDSCVTRLLNGEQEGKQRTCRLRSKENKLRILKEMGITSPARKFPLVRFLYPDGIHTRDSLMLPEKWDIVDEKTQKILLYREQLPIMLAWAMSIHKSQGQTIQKVKVDLSRIFAEGQAYVALSRAVSRDGLQVLNFEKSCLKVNPSVAKFYKSISGM